MPNRSKGRAMMKCSPWFSRFEVERGAYGPLEEIYCYETVEEGCSPSKVEEYIK
jgi:hypothetical protein